MLNIIILIIYILTQIAPIIKIKFIIRSEKSSNVPDIKHPNIRER